jgi:3-hydroxyacyl-CoA dehydrogenase
MEKNPDIGILGPKQINDNGKMAMNVRAFPKLYIQVARRTFLRHLPFLKKQVAYDEMRHLDYDKIQDVDWLQSSCMMVRSALWKEIGGFKMGPFELMDLIGNDVNYKVTESIFEQSYFEPRFKPSITQKRLVEAKMLGKKTGRGFYDYSQEIQAKPNTDRKLGTKIFNRILVLLINEAADSLLFSIATKEDIDLAMTLGVNYPKGLFKWADEIGISNVINQLQALYDEYGEDRYRISPMLKRMAERGWKFYN